MAHLVTGYLLGNALVGLSSALKGASALRWGGDGVFDFWSGNGTDKEENMTVAQFRPRSWPGFQNNTEHWKQKLWI